MPTEIFVIPGTLVQWKGTFKSGLLVDHELVSKVPMAWMNDVANHICELHRKNKIKLSPKHYKGYGV